MISIWEKETYFAPQDVLIIGGGLVGLWSAFHLKKKHPKIKITIIDRGIIPEGASTRNAGFACFGSLSELVSDAQTMGTDNMLKLVTMRYKGLQQIQKYFKKETIDFDLCGGNELYNVGDKTTTEDLSKNIAYINSILKPITKTKNTFLLADESISKYGFGGTQHLVKNKLEGLLHSGKLVQTLTRMVQEQGVQIFNAVNVKGFQQKLGRIEVETENKLSFSALQLLICTNAFATELMPDIDIVPARGQVLVTSPIKDLRWSGTFHSDEGYYYFRNLGDRVLLGGARNKSFDKEKTTEFETSEVIQQELERYLSETILPHQKRTYTIDLRWSGIMAMGSHKMPIIKEVRPNVFCAVRMSGMGVALAPVVGKLAAQKLTSNL